MRPPNKRSGPDTTPGRSAKHSTTAGEATASVQQQPVPLSEAIAELLAVSDERDLWLRWLFAAQRQAYEAGKADGWREGWREAEWDMAFGWHQIAGPVARSGGLERRRWGPGGRARFGDPRPGDYPGQHGGDAA